MFHILHLRMSFEMIVLMTEQRKRLLKAKVATALLSELGRQPTAQEIEKFTLAARVLYKAVLGLHFEREQQKATGQLVIF